MALYVIILHVPLPGLGGGGFPFSLESGRFSFSCLAIKANCLFVCFTGSKFFLGFFGLGFATLIGCLCRGLRIVMSSSLSDTDSNGSGITEAHFAKVSKEDGTFLKIIVFVCGQESITQSYTNVYMVHLSKYENSDLIKNEIILQKCSTIVINNNAFAFKYSGTNLGYPVMFVFCKCLEVCSKLFWCVHFVFALVM